MCTKNKIVTTRAAIPVRLGTTTSFTSADIGDKGLSYWGVALPFYGSDYSTSSKQARETALTGPAGVGECGAAYAIGEAGSDFGPWGGDDGGQGVKYTRIYIDF